MGALEQDLSYLRRKAWVAGLCFALAVAFLLWRLWYLQVRQGGYYYAQANAQVIAPLTIPAPRGEILDNSGFVLARDVPSFTATLSYTPQPLSAAEVHLLATILGMQPQAIAQAAQTLRSGGPLAPVVLRTNLSDAQYTTIVQDGPQLLGVNVVPEPLREYPGIPGDPNPGTALAANILGYIGAGNFPGDVIGQAGIENSYNSIALPGGGHAGLAGTPGQELVQVDRQGHPLRTVELKAPQPGDNVVLTINAKLQAVLQQAITAQLALLRTHSFPGEGGPYPDATSGGAVVINVRTGAVLAAASVPTVNPNAFAQRAVALPGSTAAKAFAAQFTQWLNSAGHPFIDRVLSQPIAPGSTFKPITAIAALEQGAITAQQHLPCPPRILVGPSQYLTNWISTFDGNLDLSEAMAFSCDTYFYTVGAQAGIAAIDRVAQEFGLGQLTGQHDLYGENPGSVSSPQTAAHLGEIWSPTVVMQSAIGQGYNAFNLLQVADYVAALANGGTLWRPYFVSAIQAPDGKVLWQQRPQVRRQIPVSPAIMADIHQAMDAVTQINPSWYQDGAVSDHGTGYYPFYGFAQETQQYLGQAITVAGKTGTAQLGGTQTPDGWWISYAPANNPQIAVVVRTDHSNEGFVGGAPVAREVYDYYFGLDRAMWKAGAANVIVPAIVQNYFGLTPQYPSWWGAPPAPGSGTTAAGASAAGGAG